MRPQPFFSVKLFKFLKELERNNDRKWFQANKARFQLVVRDPFLLFIREFAAHLRKISPCFVADPRPVGGSLFRIYRDIRFSKDKSPYKTHIASHFPHRDCGRYGHAPGFYLHLEPDSCFAGAGLWHPNSQALGKVRTAITTQSAEWKKVRRAVPTMEGEMLIRPPQGYDPNHPFVEDLKRKDFVASVSFTEAQVCRSSFLVDFVHACEELSPLVKFLTRAIGLQW